MAGITDEEFADHIMAMYPLMSNISGVVYPDSSIPAPWDRKELVSGWEDTDPKLFNKDHPLFWHYCLEAMYYCEKVSIDIPKDMEGAVIGSIDANNRTWLLSRSTVLLWIESGA